MIQRSIPLASGAARARAGAAASQPLRSIPLESQAQRRRAQLIRAAAILIESKGVDNLRMAEVAKIASCSRQVVHSYFARREDLLVAVLTDFERVLQRKLGALEGLIMDPATFGPDQLADWGQRVAGAAWELIAEEGAAGLFLAASPYASPMVADWVAHVRQPFVERWMDYIEPVLSTRADAEMVVELWIATFYRLALKWRAGEVNLEEGNELLIRYCVSILQGIATRE